MLSILPETVLPMLHGLPDGWVGNGVGFLFVVAFGGGRMG